MSQASDLLNLFRAHENRLTLGEICKTHLAYEWRARATELRRKGYIINLVKMDNKMRSNNLYELIEPDLGEAQSVEVSSPLCQESTGESERTHGAEAVNPEPKPSPSLSKNKPYFVDGQRRMELGI